MADFADNVDEVVGEVAVTPEYEKVPEGAETAAAVEESAPAAPARWIRDLPETMIDATKPLTVIYCGVCSMPPEFCEFGACFDRCRPWIEANCPEVLDASLTAAVGKLGVSEGGVSVFYLSYFTSFILYRSRYCRKRLNP